MLIIGITGNIGSGKSTVCHILRKLGAVVIDADKLGHYIYRPYSSTWQKLIENFGRGIVRENDEIDRQKLGEIVFSCPASLAKLNGIMHPQIYKEAQQRINSCYLQQVQIVALEASLLIEASWQDLVDTTWLVVTSRDKMLQRLGNNNENQKSIILARLKAQMPVNEKMKYADEVINNDGNINELEARVQELWKGLTSVR